MTLVGQSMGGHTAMLVAASRPDLVDRLVLLETDASGTGPDEPSTIRHFFESWPPVFRTRQALLDLLGDTPLHRARAADLAESGAGFVARFEPRVMGDVIRGLVEPRWVEWEGVRAQTLVVFGERGMLLRARPRRPGRLEER